MPLKICILSAANKHMQRLGYLKLLAHRASRTETSNLSALANQLVDAVTKRVPMTPPYAPNIVEYVRHRLSEGAYADLRRAVISEKPQPAALELQDLYLADPRIPSTTGKLINASREKYPYLGTAIELIKPGTWSAVTRSLTLLALVPAEELSAFETFNQQSNPMLLSKEQAALFLYCLIDNDAEILFPLFEKLLQLPTDSFDERIAGDMLPEIIRNIVNTLGKTSLPVEDRERLNHLAKVAGTIASYRDRNYSGTTAREVSIRVRLEPYCDIGLFSKAERHRFVYQITPAFRRLMTDWRGKDLTENFLQKGFFTMLAGMHGLVVKEASETEAREALLEAGEKLKSTLGYSPIKDCSLLAGVRLLFEHQKILELGSSHATLLAWRKDAPDFVRFTVDRMGELTYVKFLTPATPPPRVNA